MPKITAREVAALALDAGLSEDQAVIAVAIAKGESGHNTTAVGDVSLQNNTWGPSIGLWQIRSLWAHHNTGKTRDGTRLTEPRFNARSMRTISGRGTNWNPWTIYTNGAYRNHLTEARKAVREASGGGRLVDVNSDNDDRPLPPSVGGGLVPGTTSGLPGDEREEGLIGGPLGRLRDSIFGAVLEAIGIEDLRLAPWIMLGVALAVFGAIAILADVGLTRIGRVVRG